MSEQNLRPVADIENELAEAQTQRETARSQDKAKLTKRINELKKELEAAKPAEVVEETPEPIEEPAAETPVEAETPKPKKAPTLHVADVTWQEPGDEVRLLDYEGYRIRVAPVKDAKGKTTDWAFETNRIDENGEAGEIIIEGKAKSMGGAMRQAGNPVNMLVRETWKENRKAERDAAAKAKTDPPEEPVDTSTEDDEIVADIVARADVEIEA
jgi:hypothetical protein